MFRILITILICTLFVPVTGASVDIPYLFIKNYSVDDYKASCQNAGFSLTSDGMMYVANNSGLLTFDGNSWKLYELPDHSDVTAVTNYNDTIYTLGSSGLAGWTYDATGHLSHHSLTTVPDEVNFEPVPIDLPFTLPEEIEKAQPSAFATNGTLYFIGTLESGLYITDPDGKTLHHLHTRNLLPDNMVRAICVQDPQQIWVAFDNGLSQISLQSPIILLGERNVVGKLEDAALHEGILYIRTNTGYFKRPLTAGYLFEPITEKEAHSYLSSTVHPETLSVEQLFTRPELAGDFQTPQDIYAAGENLCWLSLRNEAALFQKETENPILKCRLLFDNYHINMATRGKRIIPLNDSLHIFSTMQGVLLVNIHQIINNSLAGGVQLKISGLEYTDPSGNHFLPIRTEEISLPNDFKEFTLYIGTTIFTPNPQISYQIEGVSSGWSPWQQDGKISFLQLPEGDYNLKIRKYVVQGPFPEMTLQIHVTPAWYNTFWAWLIYFILFILAGRLLLLYNLKNLHKEEIHRQEKERQAEEQRIQELKRKMLEDELQNKNNELTLQTTALVKRNQATQALLEELEKQKETLGDRYPNKMYNRMKSLMEENLNDQADWIVFESHFNSTHQNFVNRLRRQYSDITSGDLRICCLLRMNLSTKEIASLMNVSVRAIELRRYRLRKRLGLEGETNLVDFLMNF